MCTTERPLHLLLLDEPSTDHLIDRRFHERGADGFALSSTLAEVRNELAVVANVSLKFRDTRSDLFRGGGMCLDQTQVHDQTGSVANLEC